MTVKDDDAEDAAVASVTTDDDSESVPGDDRSTGTAAPVVTDAVAPSETSTPIPTTVATVDTATASTTPEPSNEVAGSPPGTTGDHASPVPAGAIADIGGGWRLQVLNVNSDAAAAVAAENQFNEPPPPGSTLSLITVALGYFGVEDPKTAFETTISAVGSANVELPADCGLIPQDLNTFRPMFSGAVSVGNVCFVTTPEDAPSLQLYASGDLFGGAEVFLDASAAPAGVAPMAGLAGPQPGAASTPGRLAPTPIGTPVDIGAGWTLTVNAPAGDITGAVLAENEFNAAPPDGFLFAGVNVTYAYNGDGSGSAFSVTANAVGESNLTLDTQCGVTPDAIDLTTDVFAGGSVTGVVCFVAPAASPGLVVYATADYLGSYVMFATG